VGVLFKDQTSILLSIIGITFFYVDRNRGQTQYTIYDFPEDLRKKKQYLDYFLDSLKQTKIWKVKGLLQDCELQDPPVFLKKARLESVVSMFVFSDSLVQFVFRDKSELHIHRGRKQIVFFSETREKSVFRSLGEVLKQGEDHEVKKRILYIQRKFDL
jgi:hypothetical protein